MFRGRELTSNRFEQVGGGDQTLEGTMLVDHERHVDRRCAQRLKRVQRIRIVVDRGRRMDQCHDVDPVTAAHHLMQHILGVQNSDRRVDPAPGCW